MPLPENPPPARAQPPLPGPGPATFTQVAGAVFWSFFGVRKGRDMLQDATTIKPFHVIVVGLVAGLAFVVALLVLVRVILHHASQ